MNDSLFNILLLDFTYITSQFFVTSITKTFFPLDRSYVLFTYIKFSIEEKRKHTKPLSVILQPNSPHDNHEFSGLFIIKICDDYNWNFPLVIHRRFLHHMYFAVKNARVCFLNSTSWSRTREKEFSFSAPSAMPKFSYPQDFPLSNIHDDNPVLNPKTGYFLKTKV